jgi:hypothetical protein
MRPNELPPQWRKNLLYILVIRNNGRVNKTSLLKITIGLFDIFFNICCHRGNAATHVFFVCYEWLVYSVKYESLVFRLKQSQNCGCGEWICNFIDTNLKNLYVCSDHFVTGICRLILTIIDYYLTICEMLTGKPSGEFHKKHVDWAPSINVGSNKTKQFLGIALFISCVKKHSYMLF